MSMESEAHDLLMARLDDNLKDYAERRMGERGEDGRPIIGNLYQLQGMTEVHYLLKAEHPFTPQEVNELLKFQQPLEVAHACWEKTRTAMRSIFVRLSSGIILNGPSPRRTLPR